MVETHASRTNAPMWEQIRFPNSYYVLDCDPEFQIGLKGSVTNVERETNSEYRVGSLFSFACETSRDKFNKHLTLQSGIGLFTHSELNWTSLNGVTAASANFNKRTVAGSGQKGSSQVGKVLARSILTIPHF